MQKILSTYLFVSRKLNADLLAQIKEHGFSALEIFCSRAHFDYGSKQEIQALKAALEAHHMALISLHAPTSKDTSATRESGIPLSVCEVERVRRIEAMDEFKRAIDVSEDLPFSRMVLHMGGSRETADPRKRDAAFSSLEHLVLHAHHAGVTLALENTSSEMGDPAYLRAFVDETRLTGLRFNFDIGHANLADGPAKERLEKSFAPLRDLVAELPSRTTGLGASEMRMLELIGSGYSNINPLFHLQSLRQTRVFDEWGYGYLLDGLAFDAA